MVTLGITAIAGVMRFWDLGTPSRLISDENYYGFCAWPLIHHGYVTGYVDFAQLRLNQGITLGLTNDTPGFPVHPPTGMWLIGAGEAVYRTELRSAGGCRVRSPGRWSS